jgi:hypothetical protein
MPGVSNRTKLNVSPNEQDLWRVVSEVNRLPFAFVGAGLTRVEAHSVTNVDEWQPMLMTPTVDLDSIVAGGTSATIPSGGEGVYQFAFQMQVSGAVSDVRVTANGTDVASATLPVGVSTLRISPPMRLDAGDVVRWERRSASLLSTLNAGSMVSFHRLGLLP